ncbi:hypothetical protein JCM6882_005351 [Rhodosporidiobolus microsporus]
MARIVVHSSPLDFLQAIAPVAGADSNLTNHLVGFVFERWLRAATAPIAPNADAILKPDEEKEILVTVWEGDELRLMFSKLDWAQCKIVSPLPPSCLAELAVPLLPQLVSHLLTLSPLSTAPHLLRSIAGPQLLVDALLSLWPHPSKPEPSMWMLPASTTTPPPPISFPPGHSIERIRDIHQITPSELEAIAHLQIAFFHNHDTAPKLSLEEAIAYLYKAVPFSGMWVYRAPPSPSTDGSPSPSVPVGFVTTGRPTLRTVAIRGVFVSPSHRRQGIAGRAVAAVTRAHLVDAPALPLDYSQPPLANEAPEDGATKWGGKKEICLFVEPDNPVARGVYGKIGFVESENVWCDADLEGIEPGHW